MMMMMMMTMMVSSLGQQSNCCHLCFSSSLRAEIMHCLHFPVPETSRISSSQVSIKLKAFVYWPLSASVQAGYKFPLDIGNFSQHLNPNLAWT